MRKLLSKILGEERLTLLLYRYPFLQVILLSPWFRVAGLALAASVMILALLWSRIWTSTPPGIDPPIKVRGLHLIQSWSLQRTAQRAEAAGQWETALTAWRTALGNDPGNTNLARRYLQAVRQGQKIKIQASFILGPALWLLRLSNTNQSDLELTVQVFHQRRLHDLVLNLLEPRSDVLNPTLEAIYLKTLFNTDQLPRFARRWERVRHSLPDDPELKLYRSAYQAGWAAGSAAKAGQNELESMQEDPTWGELACRLQLGVDWNLKDVVHYAKPLLRLQGRDVDTLADHVTYWRLLAETGHKTDAIRWVQSNKMVPSSAGESLLLARTELELGLRDTARSLLQQGNKAFPYAEPLWIAYANLLWQDKNWPVLTALALQIRQEKAVADSLAGYSYFLEGLAQHARQNSAEAIASFRRVPNFKFNNAYLGMEVALHLQELDHPEIARDLLVKFQDRCTNSPAYWELLQSVASDLKLADLRLAAAQQAYQLKPDDWVAMNNLAAALITLRQQPEESVKLTIQLLVHWPDMAAIKINHCMALLANRRTPEAMQMLRTIMPAQLSALETHWFYFAWLEACLDLHDYPQARLALDKLNPKLLFPNQLKWLVQARQILAEKTPGS
jgi:tetratricopeptide (TPR) repeat protein